VKGQELLSYGFIQLIGSRLQYWHTVAQEVITSYDITDYPAGSKDRSHVFSNSGAFYQFDDRILAAAREQEAEEKVNKPSQGRPVISLTRSHKT